MNEIIWQDGVVGEKSKVESWKYCYLRTGEWTTACEVIPTSYLVGRGGYSPVEGGVIMWKTMQKEGEMLQKCSVSLLLLLSSWVMEIKDRDVYYQQFPSFPPFIHSFFSFISPLSASCQLAKTIITRFNLHFHAYSQGCVYIDNLLFFCEFLCLLNPLHCKSIGKCTNDLDCETG